METIHAAERALQALTGGEVDAVAGPGGAPMLPREAQERLKKSESHFRAIFENKPECVKIVSPDGVLLEMNPAGLRMIDAPTADRVVGRPVLGLVHPEDRATFWNLHTRACGGATGQAQFRIIGLSGTERWMESHSAPLRAADGSVTSVLSVTGDATQRLRAEDVLRASEARFRVLFDQAAVGMCLVSAEGEFLRTNRRFCEIVGYSAAAPVRTLTLDNGTEFHSYKKLEAVVDAKCYFASRIIPESAAATRTRTGFSDSTPRSGLRWNT